jgi:hypothetical protein
MTAPLTIIKRKTFVILAILTAGFLFNLVCGFLKPRDDYQQSLQDKNRFAGSAKCASCHAEIYKEHIQTAHYLDSRPATKQFIKGSFADGKNKFIYNKWMQVRLEEKEGRFFQTAYINGMESQAAPFDVVIGSGRKGQSYLYWDGPMLYQLPVSYFTLQDNWCNSPGFPNNFIRYDRIIPGQCLECHSTYARILEDKDNISTFDSSQMIFGIDCERCHGPAADHVEFHQQHPGETAATHMLKIKMLGRQQRLDACAICHSGFRKQVKAPFSFQTGDKLDEHSIAGFKTETTATLDVHGNQYGLLTASRCFTQSQMDCSSCHNVHNNEVNKPALFSSRCITCHRQPDHASLQLSASREELLKNNCIDCHMPMLPSRSITLNVANGDKQIPDTVRTHHIGIYPEKSKDYLSRLAREH